MARHWFGIPRRENKAMDDQTHRDNPTDEPMDDATQGMIDDLQDRLAEAEGRYKRALADYQNFQRRSLENERRSHESGAAGVVERLVPVLDHMRLALEADPAKVTSASILSGVRVTLDEFSKVLGQFGVEVIDPRENAAFDPMRHEALMRAEKPGVKPGHIVQTFQIGYAMGERIIRPAKVSVSPSDETAADAAESCGPGCGCASKHTSENFDKPDQGDVRVHAPKAPPPQGGGGCCGGSGAKPQGGGGGGGGCGCH